MVLVPEPYCIVSLEKESLFGMAKAFAWPYTFGVIGKFFLTIKKKKRRKKNIRYQDNPLYHYIVKYKYFKRHSYPLEWISFITITITT